jgi:hypothetical protein
LARFDRALGFTALAAAAATMGCDATITSVGAWKPIITTGLYLEAEDGELSGGFTIVDDPTASNGQGIAPPVGVASLDQPGQARARYTFNITTPATYLVWGRIHSPDAIHNTFWIQLDGATWYHWRITTGEVWWWNPFHNEADYYRPLKFDLIAGPHELLLANSVDGNQLDRLYVTADSDTPPGNDTPCNPPHSIQLDGGCAPSCGSQGGNACGQVCMGHTILQAYDCAVCCIVPPPSADAAPGG